MFYTVKIIIISEKRFSFLPFFFAVKPFLTYWFTTDSLFNIDQL